MLQAPHADKPLRLSSKLRAPGTRADCTSLPLEQLLGVNSTKLKEMLSEAARAVLDSRPSAQQVCSPSILCSGLLPIIQPKLRSIAGATLGALHLAPLCLLTPFIHACVHMFGAPSCCGECPVVSRCAYHVCTTARALDR